MTDEPDLVERVISARLSPVRRELYEHGEITLSGLRRLDAALGLSEADTYALTGNQCDGCMRGLPLDDDGIHWGEGYDMIGCTAHRYA